MNEINVIHVYRCSICRHVARVWIPFCSICGEINAMREIKPKDLLKMGEHLPVDEDEENEDGNQEKEDEDYSDEDKLLIPLGEVDSSEPPRFSSGDPGLDHVLGSGLVRGSVVALYGPPGIGKSTLLTKVGTRVANRNMVLYAAGEERASRVSRRVKRLKLLRESPSAKDNFIIVQNANETDILCALIVEQRPILAIVDSFASLESERATGRPGGQSQVAYAAKMLVDAARATGTSIIAIGHETKDGRMAGPSVARHEVDTLLAFEHVDIKKDGTPGKRSDIPTGWIRLRADGKNRDGDASAIWVYRMTEHGLISTTEEKDDAKNRGPANRESDREDIECKAPARSSRKSSTGRLERKVRPKESRSSSEVRAR